MCRGRRRLRTVGERGNVSQGVREGGGRKGRGGVKGSYAVINDMLVAGIIIDVYCDAAEGGDFGGELIEAGIVLSGFHG